MRALQGRLGDGSGAALGGHDEREQTLNQIVTEMDGFDPREGMIVLAATNRADVLDAALQRPGRFDRRFVVQLPDRVGRAAILEVHTRKVPLAPNVSLTRIAAETPGLVDADLRNLVNEADRQRGPPHRRTVSSPGGSVARRASRPARGPRPSAARGRVSRRARDPEGHGTDGAVRPRVSRQQEIP